jgi:hypothetical protein
MKNNNLSNFVTPVLTKQTRTAVTEENWKYNQVKPDSLCNFTFVSTVYFQDHTFYIYESVNLIYRRKVTSVERVWLAARRGTKLRSCWRDCCCRVFEEAVNSSCLHVAVRWFPLARARAHLPFRKWFYFVMSSICVNVRQIERNSSSHELQTCSTESKD